MIYGQPIAPTSYKRPGLPRALDHVMATALAPDPDDRYQDARAFAEALRQVAHHHGMLSSAPQLAEDLRDILGPDPSRWLQEDADAYPAPDTQKIQSQALEGKEASSIGVVDANEVYTVGDVSSKSPTVIGHGDDADELDLDSLLALSAKAPHASRSAPQASSVSGAGAGDSPLAIPIDDDEDADVPTSRSQPVSAGTRAPPPPTGSRVPPPPPPPRVTGSGRAARPTATAAAEPPTRGRARITIRGRGGAVRGRGVPLHAGVVGDTAAAHRRRAPARNAAARVAVRLRVRPRARAAAAAGTRPTRARAAPAAAVGARAVAAHLHA